MSGGGGGGGRREKMFTTSASAEKVSVAFYVKLSNGRLC